MYVCIYICSYYYTYLEWIYIICIIFEKEFSIRLAYTRKLGESNICCMCLRKTENLIVPQPMRLEQQIQSVTDGLEERWRVCTAKLKKLVLILMKDVTSVAATEEGPADKAACFPGSLYLWPLKTGTALSKKGSPFSVNPSRKYHYRQALHIS